MIARPETIDLAIDACNRRCYQVEFGKRHLREQSSNRDVDLERERAVLATLTNLRG